MLPNHTRTINSPHEEPLSIREAKDYLYVNHDLDNTLIYNLIVAAREQCEAYTGRSLMYQERVAEFSCFPYQGTLELPYGPVRTIEEVYYEDQEINKVVVDPDSYYLAKDHFDDHVVLRFGQVWPTPTLDPANSVFVRYWAGWGDQHNDIPMTLRMGMLHYIAHMYENREVDEAPMSVYKHWDKELKKFIG